MSIPFNLEAQTKYAQWLLDQRAKCRLAKNLRKSLMEIMSPQIQLIFLVGEGKAPKKRNLTNLKKRNN